MATAVQVQAQELGLSVDEFCRREYPRLYGSLRLYCNDVWLAEELTQEALARAVRDWSSVATMASPTGWLHRVGINLANSTFRRRAAEHRALRRSQSFSDVHEDADTPTLVAVRRAVAALPPRQREVVILRYFHDLPVRDAAVHMDCAEGTVTSLLSDAMRSLRAHGLEVDADA